MSRLTVAIIAAFIVTVNVGHAAPPREQRYQLSIEQGPLASVLAQLARQTGLHIGAEITVNHSRASRFAPFVGYATADDAMRALLKGTDLWYAWRTEDTIRVFHVSAQRVEWSSPVSTAKEASQLIRRLAGVHYETGKCGDLLVGPFNSGEPMTAEAFWVELIRQHCTVIPKRTSDIAPSSVERLTEAGEAEHSFSVPEIPRLLALQRISEQAGVVVDYLSADAREEQAPVGPISGSMTLNEALKLATRNSVLRIRWAADDIVSVEPAYTLDLYADMGTCRCNFGLPEMQPVASRDITVEGKRLPPISPYAHAPVMEFDRAFIDAVGASTIPELLDYLAQQSFSRSRGHYSNGAQYFEGRGYGAQYSLVLIDGHRAYGSAGDPLTNAFDLNAVPLAAVERLEVALEQPSLQYGTDAIGGTVNIVLKRQINRPTATLSLGTARGGADSERATLSADTLWRKTKAGFVFEHLARDDLLGSRRERWRNQNYTRYRGGQDYRLPYGVPPNVRAISGNLPGLDTSFAAFDRTAGGFTLRPNGTNSQSALAYAAIEPEQERSSLYGFAHTELGSAELGVDVLVGRQHASLQLFPEGVESFRWGAHHPQNFFAADVLLATLLIGLPPRKQQAESTLARLTVDLKGTVYGWEYSAFMTAHKDRSITGLSNFVNPSVLADSLITSDPSAALNVLSDRPGEGHLPAGLLLPRQVNHFETQAMQYGVNLSGRPVQWETGSVITTVGLAHRLESVRFDAQVGQLDRSITSLFSQLRAPITCKQCTSLLRQWELGLGARRDFHNDVRDVTTWQSSLAWEPTPRAQFRAAYSTLFRPPSLYELYLPRMSLPYEVFDPQRNEVSEITWVSGGNSSLHLTEAKSLNVGLSLRTNHGLKASLNYWDTRMRGRVASVLSSDLINARDDVAHRVLRDHTTATAHTPGRLLMLDTTRANFGALNARGFDVSMECAIDTVIGRVTPGIDVTRIVDFQYRDLPSASASMAERAGIASLYGTIPSLRAVASLAIDWGTLSATTFARHHSSYQDYSIITGALTGHRIRDQTLLDLRIAKDIGSHLTLSVGANNVLDQQPPFAEAGGWEGFDSSQGDLIGRQAFLEITGSF